MFKFSLAIVGAMTLASSAMAQSPTPYSRDYPATTGSTEGIIQNNTGGGADIVESYGPTGADTVTNNSAAGGNAQRPELRVPNGSAGGR